MEDKFPICPKCHRKLSNEEAGSQLNCGCGYSGVPSIVDMESYEAVLSGEKVKKSSDRKKGMLWAVAGALILIISVAFRGSGIITTIGLILFMAGVLRFLFAGAKLSPVDDAKKIKWLGIKIAQVRQRLERENSKSSPDMQKVERYQKELAKWEQLLQRVEERKRQGNP